MTAAEIRAVEQVAVSPAQRLIVALAAVHAARPAAIRELTLHDLDPPYRRITIARPAPPATQRAHLPGPPSPAQPSPYRLAAHPNQHVLISEKTAFGTESVSQGFAMPIPPNPAPMITTR